MVHNRIIAGGEPEMLVLLRVPARFPDATDEHKADWQNSVVAWWLVPEKRPLMERGFGRLSEPELDAVKSWLRVRYGFRSPRFDPVLVEVESAVTSLR
ncbi:MAG: hypothetical protein HZA22_01420 [Nitrospirae bacterium]|nr:hypothetical protein [Nitrospirota bacterium]MBI5696113.1 hypothetical protein [Nitrospirota bacterium]